MKFIRKTTEAIIVTLYGVMVLTVFLQVVARYVFNSPPVWTEELARYCQVWIIILTSSVCIRKGSHLAVDYLTHKFPAALNRLFRILSHVLIAVYVAAVTVFGWRLMIVGYYQDSPAMKIKMAFVYIIFPLGGLLMLVETVLNIHRTLRKDQSAGSADDRKGGFFTEDVRT
jgi:TRAP-type C4-dicarboxylate transport system permease small subunit